ncbi:MAG: DNA translocase FtsK [Thiotrichaceae bacterium]|uniref:DNA translocase FtsK n=1 Tax=Candidatus Thiocaldithrix dubininis TaxID=3080823 RepID=A0AA95KHH5_9GAMM|nr:MAG: DNA translocase FtsK 4TM domain-containing protein [Candidatus Thiocaldithrix dubininis]
MANKLHQQKRASVQQAIVIACVGLAALVLLALLSYDPQDPGPFYHNSQTVMCHNKAGCKGAWLANFLFNLLGYLAYAVPVLLVALGLNAFRINPYMKNHNNPVGGMNDVVTALGAVLTLFSGAGLANLLFDPYPYATGGGILGHYVANIFTKTFLGFYGALLFLLSIFLSSITLVTDISWLQVADKVGDWFIQLFEGAQQPKTNNGKKLTKPSNNANSSGSLQAWLAKLQGLFAPKTASNTVTNPVDNHENGNNPITHALEWLNQKTHQVRVGRSAVLPENSGVDVSDIKGRRDPVLETPNFSVTPPVDLGIKEPIVDVGQPIAVSKLPKTKPKAPAPTVSQDSTISEEYLKALAEDVSLKNQLMVLPRLTLLNAPPAERVTQTPTRLTELADKLVAALGHYGVNNVRVVAKEPGPVITRFELELPDGTKASKISGLATDLARNMCVSSVRVVEVIPGRPTIGVEIPNDKRDVVMISELLASPTYKKHPSPLTIALGKDISGNPVVADLAKMPHLLVAGTTGSGKSVFINAMLMSLLFKATPEEVRMIMIDPKMLELSSYEDIPHLLAPVVTDMKHAANALRWCVAEMERRYLLMAKLKVRNIAGFNDKIREAQDRGEQILDPLFDPNTDIGGHADALKPLPYIVVIVDEFADMMMVVGKKVEELIARLAQKARASGIHLILATQRPSVDVITGLIKANIPTRIAFQVSTKIDSRTILDQGGAEQLLGYGDMLYMPPGTSLPQRIHGALVTDKEVEDVTIHLKQQGEPDYIADVLADSTSPSDAIPGLEPLAEREGESDPLYDEAVAIVIESRRASISYLQRRLKVGYNRAARMIEDMETAGVVSAVSSNGSREVLVAAPPRD